MKKFKNHQRPRRKYRINIVGHKKSLKKSGETVPLSTAFTRSPPCGPRPLSGTCRRLRPPPPVAENGVRDIVVVHALPLLPLTMGNAVELWTSQ